jgi:hypothetical protein
VPLVVVMYEVPVAPAIGDPFRNHWLPVAALEVSVSGWYAPQTEVGPPGVMVGVAGVGETVTMVPSEVTAHDPPVTWMA